MRRTPSVLAAALALSVGLLAAGCGSSDEAKAPTPTKAAFTKRANAICRKADKELSDVAEKAKMQEKSKDEQVTFIRETFLPRVRQEVEDLRDLGYPKGDEAKLGKIWDDADAAIADVQEHTKKALEMEGSPFDKVDKALEAYPLKGCTQL